MSLRLRLGAIAAAVGLLTTFGCGGEEGDPAAASSCRKVLANATFSGSETGSIRTTFDEATNKLTYWVTMDNESLALEYHYPTKDAFIDEPKLLGRVLRSREVSTEHKSTKTTLFSFDAAQRLTGESAERRRTDGKLDSDEEKRTTTYTAWDAHGRPTAGLHSRGSCKDAAVTITYDAATRTHTQTIDYDAGQGCDPGVAKTTTTFDADGNFVGIAEQDRDGSQGFNITIKPSDAREICR